MPEKPLVAIVDDDESHRRATQSLLKAAGYSTVAFDHAESFLGSADRASVACLVTDMRMPGMSGLELYRALVASGEAIAAVLVTAYADDATRQQALEAGITCCLGKPFAADDLLACIQRALRCPGRARLTPKS
jgi:FixJ family two-component response regulator